MAAQRAADYPVRGDDGVCGGEVWRPGLRYVTNQSFL